MAPLDTKQAKVSELAHTRLGELRDALASQIGPKDLKLEDVLSALILYTPTAQAAMMLREYWWYTSKL
jgi:hypothetical protein